MSSKKIRHNGQDIMMNLLGESSDSGPEPLNLPPIKGKRPKRKRNYGSQDMCSLWTFAKMFLFLLLIAAIATLSAISYWLIQQVDDLKGQLYEVSMASESSLEDYQKLHSQIQEINKTITTLRTGNSGLDTLYTNLTQLSGQIKQLTEETEKLKSGLKEAPELRNIPMRLTTLSQTVGTLGSNLNTVKSEVETLTSFRDSTKTNLQQLATDLDEIKAKVSRTTPSPPSTAMPKENGDIPVVSEAIDSEEIQRKFATIGEQFQTLNSSLAAKMLDMQNGMIEHGSRTADLENKTKNILADIDLLKLDHPVENSSLQADWQSRVRSLVEEMLNVSSKPTQLPLPGTTLLDDYKTQTDGKIKYLNVSYIAMHEDLEDLISKVALNKNDLFNLSHEITGIHRFMAATGQNTVAESSNANITSSPGTTTTSSPNTPDTNRTSPDKPGTTTSSPGKPVLHIDGINSAQDLEMEFQRWDTTNSEKIQYQDILDHRPSSSLPSETDLKQYDEDGDDYYTLGELKTALGFSS
ncbi:hypothetical protein ScPMuIL_001722 [Solemya velum]